MEQGTQLQLNRPLVTFDLETTGLSAAHDRIVEIACVKTFPDGSREITTKRINPQQPISSEASAVHGIYDADVADCPTFESLAPALWAIFDGCDLGGFNIEKFDLPMLTAEFKRADMVFPQPGIRLIDSWLIFAKKEPRDLTAAYKFYCGGALTDAHQAEADAVAAADVLLAQVARYDDVPGTIAGLDRFCHPEQENWLEPSGKIAWKENEAVLNFGRYRNQTLRSMREKDPGYLRWMANASFSPEVHSIVVQALAGEFPHRGAAGKVAA